MEEILIAVVAVLSAAFVYPLVRRMHPGRSVPSIVLAGRAFFEWVGLFAFFFIFNVLIGAALIIGIRNLTARFVGLYDLESGLLPVISAAEGFIFQRLWKWD